MGFNEIEKDFIFVAFDRTIKETDANMYNRIKKLISFLSLKYSFVIYDNPEYLTKEEGLELTKNCLYGKKSINKRLKTILFIMDNSPIEEGTSLDLCFQFCLERDREFNEKRKNNIFYGAGFSRYIISTCENPNDVITFLNTERRFYDSKNIACSLKAESPKTVFQKMSRALYRYKIVLPNISRKNCSIYKIKNASYLKPKKLEKLKKSLGIPIIRVKEYNGELDEFIYENGITIEVANKHGVKKVISKDYSYEGNIVALYYMIPSEKWNYIQTYDCHKRSFLRHKEFQQSCMRIKPKLKNHLTFISYSHKNNIDESITRFVDSLETTGIDTFFDVYDFVPGDDWEKQTEIALGSRGTKILCMISKEYMESEACLKEISLAAKSGLKLYLYDPNHLLDDASLSESFIYELAKNNYYNSDKKKYIHAKKIVAKKQLLKYYNKIVLDINMGKRSIVCNYEIKNPKPCFLVQNCKTKDNHLQGQIVKNEGKYYFVDSNGKQQIYRSLFNCQRYVLNNESFELYENKSIEKNLTTNERFYCDEKKSLYFMSGRVLKIGIIPIAIISLFYPLFLLIIPIFILSVLCSHLGIFMLYINLKSRTMLYVSIALVQIITAAFIGFLATLYKPNGSITNIVSTICILFLLCFDLFLSYANILTKKAFDFLDQNYFEDLEDIE